MTLGVNNSSQSRVNYKHNMKGAPWYLGVETRIPLGPEADVDVEAHGTFRHVTVGHAQIPQDLTLKKPTRGGQKQNRAREEGVVTPSRCCLLFPASASILSTTA